MRIVDLSMPIWEGAGYGEVLPFTNTPVRLFEYMVYERHGMRRTLLKLDGETGSPFMVPTQNAPHSFVPLQPDPLYTWTLSDIPLDRLLLRDTAILDIPAEADHEITPDEVQEALARTDFRPGDELLLRTGWGTLERAYGMGIEYWVHSPSLRHDAGVVLAEAIEAKGSSIFITDAGLVNPPSVQGHDWFMGDHPEVPLPRPWPSAEARERRMDLGRRTHASPVPSSYGFLIRKTIACCKCLVNCDQLPAGRVKLLILPLLIRQGGASPARFFALVE